MRYLDLFAGAGGLSEGFIKAGFEPVAHVELSQSACYTLKTRTAFHFLEETNNITMKFDTEVTNCNAMFNGLSNITLIDLSKFDAPNLINMTNEKLPTADPDHFTQELKLLLSEETVMVMINGQGPQSLNL